MKATLLRVRPSIEELADQYKSGDKKPLETVMRAWKGIKELPPNDPNSFFMLGGYHGEPFRGAGWGNPYYWGGYCNHGNVLFPTWHRVYLVKLEEALQSIPGCKDVMLPYWDETSDESAKSGIPWPLTDEFFVLDGKKIPNPLRSFVFPQTIQDNINTDDPSYTKPKDYETVRYPLSGLVGSDSDAKATKAHNKKFPNYKKNVELLNQNVVRWLTSYVVVKKQKIPTNVIQKYKDCLDAPNYTLFSNTTSAQEWNTNPPNGKKVVALENPHNSIHLSVGGFDVPSSLLIPGGADFSPIKGANGDMGENDTAGLDPIFFFHHCHVDRVFWLWQKKNGFTDHLEIMPEYPGTNSVDNQGPTPGVVPNSWLTLETPLNPFKKTEKGKESTYTSLDCINIEKQLGYTYSKGSLEAESIPAKAMQKGKGESERMIHISGINRAPIRGSFLVTAYANIDGKKQLVGTDAILSRWTVKYCANCQTHLEVKAHFSLRGLPRLQAEDVEVEIQTRDGVITTPGHNTAKALAYGGQPAKNSSTWRSVNMNVSDPLVGSWTYRSWLNDPNPVDVTPPAKMCERLTSILFAEAKLVIEDASDGQLKGKLEMGSSGFLTLFGSVGYGSPFSVRFQGVGKEKGSPSDGWVYDYIGWLVPAWPNGVDQRPAIVGSVVRTVPHSNGQAKAGKVASFVAVKQN